MTHIFENKLIDDEGQTLGTFSSHWAACAALVRLRQPDFHSLGAEKLADLKIERQIKQTLSQREGREV